jgi:hypothetical protein
MTRNSYPRSSCKHRLDYAWYRSLKESSALVLDINKNGVFVVITIVIIPSSSSLLTLSLPVLNSGINSFTRYEGLIESRGLPEAN